jgi:DNA-nicking Smr family endonuclease
MPIHAFDRPTHRKISKGRVDIEARIDLHGLTQNDAYELLYGFLLSAHARGLKHVMVITGKGRSFGSEGVLKQAVPHWFSTPLFRLLVSAYEDAARHHGGHGALYVRLRRQTQGGGLIR